MLYIFIFIKHSSYVLILQHFLFKLGLSHSRFGSVPIKFRIYEKKTDHTSFDAPRHKDYVTAKIRRLKTLFTKSKFWLGKFGLWTGSNLLSVILFLPSRSNPSPGDRTYRLGSCPPEADVECFLSQIFVLFLFYFYFCFCFSSLSALPRCPYYYISHKPTCCGLNAVFFKCDNARFYGNRHLFVLTLECRPAAHKFATNKQADDAIAHYKETKPRSFFPVKTAIWRNRQLSHGAQRCNALFVSRKEESQEIQRCWHWCPAKTSFRRFA